MKNIVRAFIGISSNTYTLILNSNGKCKRNLPVAINTKEKRTVILSALVDCLKQVPQNSELVYYSNDNLISFEWEKEYKVNNAFSEKTLNLSLWNEVAYICKNKKINLTIKSEDNVLSAYAKYK